MEIESITEANYCEISQAAKRRQRYCLAAILGKIFSSIEDTTEENMDHIV